MKHTKKIIWISISALFVIILFATNPKEYQFKAYLKSTIQEEGIDQGGLEGAFRSIFAGSEAWLMSLTTERTNLYLCSVYSIEGQQKKQWYVGVLGTFIELH